MVRLCFFYILGCFLLSLNNLRKALARDAALLAAALLFTVLADYFLILRGLYLVGVCFFILVQLTYILRYWGMNRHLFACSILVLPAALLYRLMGGNRIIFAAAIYAQLFFMAFCGVIYAYKANLLPHANNVMALAGMALFAGCDIQVALVNAASYGVNVLPHYGGTAAYLMIWLFYAPSQLLLALSGRQYKS